MRRTVGSFPLLFLLAGVGLPGAALADGAPRADATYALVVGANRGGAGQAPLRYAERDAASVADALASVGRYPVAHITRLSQPSPAELRAALRRVRAKLRAHERRDEESSFLFYYSGHARARALDLAGGKLPLGELRRELEGLPATLTIVILDACQSGSFSRIKGVETAADFSVNSVAGLNASGMAVMASSSGSELSQESERLRSSYFTHHLLVALRGGGDDDGDGRVTLDEAYRYAYHQTLAATAVTAVGKQHVTLETDLRGKGEIPLSFPAELSSGLELPRSSRGDFLVQSRKSGSVVAEIHKVADRKVRLALVPGRYRLIVRDGDRAMECDREVPPGEYAVFRGLRCQRVVLEESAQKGELTAPAWGFELGAGFSSGPIEDAYVDRLGDFGYEPDQGFLELDVDGHYELGVTRYLGANVHLAASYLSMTGDEYRRDGDTEVETFEWDGRGLIGSLRLTHPFLWRYPTGRYGGFIPFVEAGAGVTHSRTALQVGEMPADADTHWGYAVSAAAGGQVMILPAVGFYAKARYAVAPTIENRLGDTHDIGGWFFSLGVRAALP